MIFVQLEQERAVMSDLVAVAVTALCLAAGGYGLYKVAYAQGYVCGRESVLHPDTVEFTPDD